MSANKVLYLLETKSSTINDWVLFVGLKILPKAGEQPGFVKNHDHYYMNGVHNYGLHYNE